MAYICYRATLSGCATCEHCKFDADRNENACFAGEVLPEEQYYNFLEWLRRRGITNMYCAVPYLAAEFPELGMEKAKVVLSEWMKNYDELIEKYKWR